MPGPSRVVLMFLAAGMVIGVAAVGARVIWRGNVLARMMRADPETILGDPDLAPIALNIGHKGFVDHCASCHGTGKGDPQRGIPDLTDGDFLYGDGQVAEIEMIVLHGIRAGDSKGWDLAFMPAYASVKPYAREPLPSLQPGQITDITQFLMQVSGRATDPAAAKRGKVLFKTSAGCWDCHGPDGGGDNAIGAPNLLDDVWLYGDGSPASIAMSIAYGRAGRSPAFAHAISAADARAIAVYVASLSRGRTGDHHV
jgi:cytochrome c oxidase cbb3-type subunit 3